MAAIPHPTELLRTDHQDVLEKLSDLERVIDRLNEPDAVASDLQQLGRFFDTEIWDHFEKQEQALFPEIETFLPREKGPTGQMLREHANLREVNERFQKGIVGYLADHEDERAVGLIRDSARHIVDLLKSHIHKENNALFRMADAHLSEAQNRQILELFESIDTEGA